MENARKTYGKIIKKSTLIDSQKNSIQRRWYQITRKKVFIRLEEKTIIEQTKIIKNQPLITQEIEDQLRSHRRVINIFNQIKKLARKTQNETKLV